MPDARLSRLLPLLALVFLLAGCRTYGSDDTEALTVVALQESVEQFSNAYDRARAVQLPKLQDAYDLVLIEMEAVLYNQQARAQHFAEHGGSYRDVSRALGAFLAEQARVRDRMDNVVRLANADTTLTPLPLMSRYQAVPPAYTQMQAGTN